MFRRTRLTLAVAAVAAVGTAGAASASVSYDPASGGFVGKGDVQVPLGFSNKQMQNAYNANSVTFQYDSSATYTFGCEWYTGSARNVRYHAKTYTRSIGVAARPVNDTPKKTSSANFTGWFLSSVDTSTSSTAITAADCPGDEDQGAEKSIIEGSVELISNGGGLSFSNDGGLTNHLLPNTPIVVATAL